MVLITAGSDSKNVTNKRKKWLLVCFASAVLSLIPGIVSFFVDPVQFITEMNMRLTQGSKVLEFLQREIDGMHMSVFLFNITNAQEFMSGQDHTLKVHEVGPITYKEMRRNEDMELDTEAGELRYKPKVTPHFVPEESIGRPEDISVTMPNMAYLGVASAVGGLPPFARMPFNLLAKQLRSKPMLTLDAYQYLWGYREPLVTIANTVVPGLVPFPKMGLLDRFYDKNIKNELVLGATDKDKFMIKSRNGHKKLPMDPGVNPDECAKCDSFENTYEGIIYPLPVLPESKIRIFRTGICKILDMNFQESRKLDNGATGLIFNVSDSFFSMDKNMTNDGLLDLSECFFGLPVSLSKVNFLDMDPKIHERIEGLKPNPNHTTYFVIEPLMGMEIDTFVAMQLNLVIKNVSSSPEASRFSNMVIPICYVVIKQAKLTEEGLHVLNMLYNDGPIYVLIVQVVSFLGAFVALACAARLLYRLNWDRDQGISFAILTTALKEPVTNSLSVEEPLIDNFRTR